MKDTFISDILNVYPFRATPLLAITHPSVDMEPEQDEENFEPTKSNSPTKSERDRSESPLKPESPKRETPKPTPPSRMPSNTPGKGVSVISGKCVSGWL